MLLAAAPPDKPVFMLVGILKLFLKGFLVGEGPIRRVQLNKGEEPHIVRATTLHSYYTRICEKMVRRVVRSTKGRTRHALLENLLNAGRLVGGIV